MTTLPGDLGTEDVEDYSAEVMISSLVLVILLGLVIAWINTNLRKQIPISKISKRLTLATGNPGYFQSQAEEPLYPNPGGRIRSREARQLLDRPLDIVSLKILARDASRLQKMYLSVPKNQVEKHEAPLKTEEKNRYRNIFANPYSRVRLQPTNKTLQSTYINANYVFGRRFIASQGPTPETFEDFWRMIWENNVEIIVMLTNLVEGGRLKCDRYWPDDNEETKDYGPIRITVSSNSPELEYGVTVIELHHTQLRETRTLYHYFFQGWPDHGVPDEEAGTLDDFLDFMDEVRQQCSNTPIVVHCSAGAGRTGCFMAIWAGWHQIELSYVRNPKKLEASLTLTLNAK